MTNLKTIFQKNSKNNINKEYEKILATPEDLKPAIDITLEKSGNPFTLKTLHQGCQKQNKKKQIKKIQM